MRSSTVRVTALPLTVIEIEMAIWISRSVPKMKTGKPADSSVLGDPYVVRPFPYEIENIQGGRGMGGPPAGFVSPKVFAKVLPGSAIKSAAGDIVAPGLVNNLVTCVAVP